MLNLMEDNRQRHEDKSIQHDGIQLLSLDGEAEKTTELLATTVECCQQLVERLKRQDKYPQNIQVIEEKPEEREDKLATNREIIRLRTIIQDVTEANKRWQKHHEQCQEYIQKLKQTIRELREQSSSPPDNFIMSTRVSSPTNHSRTYSSDEVTALKLTNAELEQTIRSLQREMEEYRTEAAMNAITLQNANRDHKEHVHLLEMQVEAHRVDWEAEANEKKQLQRKLSEMQEELLGSRAKIYRLQHPESCSCELGNRIHQSSSIRTRHSSPITYNIPADNSLIPRSHIHHFIACDGSEIVSDGEPEQKRPLNPEITSSSKACYSFNCPECGENFPPERHVEFLEHFEQCQPKKEDGEKEEIRPTSYVH